MGGVGHEMKAMDRVLQLTAVDISKSVLGHICRQGTLDVSQIGRLDRQNLHVM